MLSDESRPARPADRMDWRAGALLIFALSMLGWLMIALVVWLLGR